MSEVGDFLHGTRPTQMSTHGRAPVDCVEKAEGQAKHDTKVEVREMKDNKSLTERINEKLLEMASQTKI